MKTGELTPGCIDQILHDIQEGKSLRASCSAVGCSHVAFLKRVRKDEDLRQRYADAADVRAETIFDEILEIADDGRNDYMEVLNKKGELQGYRENGEWVNRSRLRVQARQWALAVMNPQKFGNRQKIDVDATVNVEGTLAEGRKRAANRVKPKD